MTSICRRQSMARLISGDHSSSPRPFPLSADDERDFNAEVNAALADIDWPGMVRMPIGVTPRGTLIWCLMDEEALNYRTPKPRVVCGAGRWTARLTRVEGCLKQIP